MNFKKEAAYKAAAMVTDDSIVGLGAGSTIAFVVEALQQYIKEGLSIQFVTSSFSTLQLLQKNLLPLRTIAAYNEIDIYFDGCDQLDRQLNALKSGGGIHTQEKLLATMSREFVLVGDEAKLTDTFDAKFPLVLEMLPQALAFVPYKVEQLFAGIKSTMRMNDKKDGPVITENGNYLLDVYFESWPELSKVNPMLKNVSGIVETSLFYNLAGKAIIAGEKGITVLERN